MVAAWWMILVISSRTWKDSTVLLSPSAKAPAGTSENQSEMVKSAGKSGRFRGQARTSSGARITLLPVRRL